MKHDFFRLSNPDRVLYAEQGITKRELASYYSALADIMVPHVAERLLTLVRCPRGNHKHCFFQKHAMAGMPSSIHTARVTEKKGTVSYVTIDDALGLFGLVQLGTLEIHTWGSSLNDIERPDRLIFDLDPDPQLPFLRVMQAARLVRDVLGELGLESFVKTTGGKGLHVVVPVRPRLNWDETKAFCKAVAEHVVRLQPQRYTASSSKTQRWGKIFVDYLRNTRGATAIAPFSTRARHGAPVSTPLHWDELEPSLRLARFTVRTLPKRLNALQRDPWQGFFELDQRTPRSKLHMIAQAS